MSCGKPRVLARTRKTVHNLSRRFVIEYWTWSAHGHVMEITITQFKAKCLGIVEQVQREKSRVVISRHGRPAAELIPISEASPKVLFGRAASRTKIQGDLMMTGETWDAEN